MTSPCKDCPDRHAHCHSACNRYGECMRPCLKKSAHSGLQMPQQTRQMQSEELRSAAMSENTDYTKQERVERRESQTTPYPGIAESR